jgi:hypothetical protein
VQEVKQLFGVCVCVCVCRSQSSLFRWPLAGLWGEQKNSSRPDLAKQEVPSSKGPGFDPSRIQARLTLSSTRPRCACLFLVLARFDVRACVLAAAGERADRI